MKRMSQLEDLREYMGEEAALEAVVRALSTETMDSVYRYICRTHDIPAGGAGR